jgi:UDP-2,3-diacylglucosamine pyrophosphatase LpxH
MLSNSTAHITESLDPKTVIWFISDLHLGDGTPSDAFFGKDRHLIALVNRIEREGATLVINGDALDFHQAWTFTRIMRAHQPLLSAFSRLSRQGRLLYVIGNHDYDISLYREILNFRVCESVHIGEEVLVTHGFQYDPYIGTTMQSSHISTRIHHLLERYLNTWLRIPLKDFYTLGNRFLFWGLHKIALLFALASHLLERVGVDTAKKALFRHLNYWTRGNSGDPMCMFEQMSAHLKEGPFHTIICGHSHLPGVVDIDGKTYANSGSWTFSSGQYLKWQEGQITCHDWISGREYKSELYQPILNGDLDNLTFFGWWRTHYLGFLRFTDGARHADGLPPWQAHILGHQLQHGIPHSRESLPNEPFGSAKSESIE